ncbi:MAG: UDP-N-acetylmuramate--L-alanine ligase [Eubacteriales bacterium]
MFEINFQKPIHVYFMGIGGISMSGLAEILLSKGFPISGSDSQTSPLTDHLEKMGAKIYYGQRASNLDDTIDLIVYTAAISTDNPEFIAMREKAIPSLTRAQLLGQIMKNYDFPIGISGTHGKTTTTSMISEILLQADTDPTLSIGGILKSIDGNIRIGESQLFVTEACEYTNSFLSFFPQIALILNIEEDHMDFFKNIEEIRNSFHQFAKLLPTDGTLIINGEIPDLSIFTVDLPCHKVSYGFDDSCDYYASEISYDNEAKGSFVLHSPNFPPQIIHLGVPGKHNISNAMAAIALSDLLEIDRVIATNALLTFSGTNRRFEVKGNIGGITIIDDYAHHPTEIAATLHATRNYPHNDVWCVFQPHTYTRTKAFLGDFATALSLADHIILADIYAAREKNTLGITSQTLQAEIEKSGKKCYYFPCFDEIENFILQNCINGDLLITMGAGDIVKVGESLLGI